MLFGRDPERQTLERLLADARAGRSRVLALVGEPGIGKTALLECAAELAGGMRVLRARGIESEAEVPFASLLELLRPSLGALGRIPAPQAAALGVALALRPGRAEDRFAVGAATLSLLAAYADDAPLLLLVDDAHWLDGSSSDALLFAFRRLVADPIAVLLTARDGEPSLLEGADLPRLHLAGLDGAAAAELLALESGEPVAPDIAERLVRATAGNPLALLELAPEAPRLAATPLELPAPVPTSIAESFRRRSDSLRGQARRVLVLAAASDGGDLAVLGAAAAALGLDLDELAQAESAGLVRLADGVVEFRHPLARSAIYASAPAQDCRDAHRALAGALPDRDVDRRAWHLASAALGPDDAASAALEQAGVRARERSAYTVSATALERAARLAPEEERRARLLYAAADAAWLAGLGDRTVGLLDEARQRTASSALAARIDHLQGHVTMRRGPIAQGRATLVAAAERIADEDAELAVVMLAEAAHACFYTGDAPGMQRVADRVAGLLPAGKNGRVAFFGAMVSGMAAIFGGEGAAGASSIRRAVELLEESDELRHDPRLLVWAAMGPLWLREDGAGRALVDRALDAARERSAVGALPYLLHHVARDRATSGDWPAAQAASYEALRLARETGQRTELAAALAGLAWLEAWQGKEQECRAHAAEASALCTELGIGIYELWAVAALGDLELGLGRPAAALEHLEALERTLESLGVADVDLSPAPELVDAYLRLGRTDDATRAAERFAARAVAKGQPWALARAARCRGLLAGDDAFDASFAEALRLHEQTPDVFEAGRTRFAYGARLRRARRRKQAREELRAALEIFDRVGASSWADLAGGELAATGETARRRHVSTLDELTPQELQIALLLRDGRTTREAAAALFLSPKTIEYHLRHVYRKLGIHSREELASAVPTGR